MTDNEKKFWVSSYAKPAIFLIVVLAAVGGFLALRIPVAVFPSTSFPRIVIGVDNGVMPIDQMMVTITRPVEETVNSVPGLTQVRSRTSRGQAEVDLFFNWQVDMIQTLQYVNAALARLQPTLPSGARVVANRLTFATFPILGYSLTTDSAQVSQSQLWEMATYDMKPRLNRLDGVSTVVVQGGQEPEIGIEPDPALLLSAGVTVTDILDAVRRTNVIDSPGLIERNHQLDLGLVSGQVRTPAELGNIVIRSTPAGVPLRLENVARVSSSVRPVYVIVNANGKSAVLLNINRQPDSNTLQVAQEVHAEISAIQKTLPPGVYLQPFYDQSTLVQQSIGSVRDAILLGLILASIILVVFLRDWGTSLVAGLVIPVTLLITFAVLDLLGQSFNLMTLGGLAAAVGLVIDDAIVVVENIVAHRDAGQTREEAVRSAFSEITVPLIGSTVTPLVVFLPLISMTGVTGSFFRALAITMAASLLTSLALALTWTPSLSLFILKTKAPRKAAEPAGDSEEPHAGSFFGRIVAFYEVWLNRALNRPLWIAALAAVLILISWGCYKLSGTDLLPEMDEGGFVVDYWMPPGSSLTETNRVIGHIEQMLREVPEVQGTSRRTGLELGLSAVTEASTGDISVKLKAKRSRTIDEIIEGVRARIAREEPGVQVEFVQVLQDMIGDLTGAPEPIQVKLFSPDASLLENWAPRVASALKKVPGVVDVLDGIENTISGPAVLFQVDPVVAARSGFTPDEVITDATALLEGVPADTPLVSNDRAYTIRVRMPEANRASLDAMRDTLLVSSAGHTATLGALAGITELPPQTEILRENLQRAVVVTARLEGVDLGTGARNVQSAVASLHVPGNIRVEYGGSYQEQQRSFNDLVRVLLLAIVLVATVLLFEFRTFAAPLAILSSALLSTSGVFLALLITQTTFNVSSFMGVIMVIGIVAKNGILLLDAEQKFRLEGISARDSLVRAGRRRLRPIVMTALATIAGMLPLAFAIGAGSQILQPLAIAVIGGIVISMVLSLLVTPTVLYVLSKHSPAGE